MTIAQFRPLPLSEFARGGPWYVAFAFALFAAIWEGPDLWRGLYSPVRRPADFFQEWASAKNIGRGLPVYAPHERTLPLYLGEQPRFGPTFISINAHPPVSVLLALPFAPFDYSLAHSLWNLFSLVAFAISIVVMVRALAIPLGPPLALVVVLILLSGPMRAQLGFGQLNLVLLLLMTGAWWADRSEHPWWAGTFLGLATAIKIFPGLLFLYFALRRRWRALAAAGALVVLSNLTAMIVLGPEAFASYARQVLPEVSEWRAHAGNCSLPGLCYKLFDPGRKGVAVEPIARAPAVAAGLMMIGCLLLLTVLAWTILRARSREDCDRAFALSLVAMLLISPISWEHYFLLLLLPLALLWQRLPPQRAVQWFFLGVLVLMWLPTWRLDRLWATLLYRDAGFPAEPAYTLTVGSAQFYALLILFGLICLAARRSVSTVVDAAGSPQRVEYHVPPTSQAAMAC